MTAQNICINTILNNEDISISGLRLNDDNDLKFNSILISKVNYSMNPPHVSSSHCNRFVPKSFQFGICFDTHFVFV